MMFKILLLRFHLLDYPDARIQTRHFWNYSLELWIVELVRGYQDSRGGICCTWLQQIPDKVAILNRLCSTSGLYEKWWWSKYCWYTCTSSTILKPGYRIVIWVIRLHHAEVFGILGAKTSKAFKQMLLQQANGLCHRMQSWATLRYHPTFAAVSKLTAEPETF